MATVDYSVQGGLATIRFDDGKANVLNLAALEQLGAAFDRAEEEARCVLWTGRAGKFCAGFDLKVFSAGGADAAALLRGGAKLAARLYSFKLPIVVGCTGHALGMGALMLLAADLRIGVDGPFKIGLPEVTIGMAMPRFGSILAASRLAVNYQDRAVCCAEIFTPSSAKAAGFLDHVCSTAELYERLEEAGKQLLSLDLSAHHQTKLSFRRESLAALQESIAEVVFQ